MDFARPIMWNVPHGAEIIFYLLIPLLFLGLLGGIVWRVRKWFLGRPEPDADSPVKLLLEALRPKQLWEWVRSALFQGRLSPDLFALTMHGAIFWGMVVLFLGTALATLDQDFAYLLLNTQLLRGRFYLFFELVLDLFGAVLILGVLMAAYRRYLLRPKRLSPNRVQVSLWDRFPFLSILLLIAISGFVVEGLRLAEGLQVDAQLAAAGSPEARAATIKKLGLLEQFHLAATREKVELERLRSGGPMFPAAPWAPIGLALAKVFTPLPLEAIRGLHRLLWWVHGLLAFGLILSLPFTKAFHLLSSPVNLLLRDTRPPGRLPVAVETGVGSVRDCTWRQLLQVEACTWCGKCQEVCPSHTCGQPLSPRDVVQAVDSQLLRMPWKPDGEAADLHEALITAEELWACCSCRACEEICPVRVQQPRLIVDLRRRLVDQGRVEEGLQDALINFQRYGNSFGQSPRKRAEWTKTLPFKPKDARKEEVEYLWFLGDYAALDQRAVEVSRAMALLLHHAGVDFGLLYEKEQNAGNDVRRIGEEGLFLLLREKNLKELGQAKFRKLLTTDPHTYNTLKNEYHDGETSGHQVVHHSELIAELIREGRFRPQRTLNMVATYHDPCYLGRFNGVYDPPREVLRALGVKLLEMPRNRGNSFCCGAGGGRIWMKDAPSTAERPAENRIREALALPGVQCLVVACPKDLAMFQDAVKTVGAENRLRVADLAQLVQEALEISSETHTEAGVTKV